MSVFLPASQIELQDAVREAAQHWHPEEMKQTLLSDDEAKALSRHNEAVKKISENAEARKPRVPVSSLAGYETHSVSGLGALFAIPVPPPPSDEVLADADVTDGIKLCKLKGQVEGLLLAQAWERVRNALYEGELTGLIFLPLEGKTIEPEAGAWGSPMMDRAYFTGHGIAIIDGKQVKGLARLRRDHLARFLQGKVPEQAPADDGQSSGRSVGGRPLKYDPVVLVIEAARLIHEGAQPKPQAELRKAALEAYAALKPDDGTPSDEWAKKPIRLLWTRLDIGTK